MIIKKNEKFGFYRKGELSFSTIVTAVIAITVMIVIIAIFINKASQGGDSLTDCDSVGKCSKYQPTDGTYVRSVVHDSSCTTDGEVCWMRIKPNST